LLEYGRFNALTEIINAFDALYDEDKNIASGTAVSAINLDEDELNRISQAYAKKYGFKKLVLTNEVDSSILGGIILKVGDRIIDGSIRTRLQQIREQLIENR
ncbi:MAG: ATP synthase F1 subunit delta, partial [Lactobacillus paragasseri]